MRFTRLRAPAFGVLEELDTGEAPLGGLVVVEGRNEAGKSTFFEVLCALLYGFHPATRETYPYAPWGGRAAEAEAAVRLDSGEEITVRRRLLSTPRGSVRQGDRDEEIRNRAVPWAEHVPRPVFQQVFALTLAELAGLQGEGWSAVQDRLLGAMGASDLRPARKVVDDLLGEAGSLWRPDRRGRQAVREIEQRIRELRGRRHAVLQEDARIRELALERDRVALELEELRGSRESARVELERLRILLPVQSRLQRIEELEARSGPPAELENFPPDLRHHRERLDARADELRRRLGKIGDDRAEPLREVGSVLPGDEALLSHRAEIERWSSEWAGAEPMRTRRATLVREIRDRERRVEETVVQLLDRDLDAALRSALRALPVPALHTAVDALLQARRRVEAATVPTPETAPGHRKRTWPGAALALVGAVLLAWGLFRGGTGLAVLGGVCLGAGLGLVLSGGARRNEERRLRREAERRRSERTDRERELKEAEGRLVRVLEPLAPGPGAAAPGPELPIRIERVQEWIREEDDRREELARIDARIVQATESLGLLARLLPDPEPPSDPGVLAHLLERALRQAGARRDAAATATRELDRLDRTAAELEDEAARLRAEAKAMDEALARIGDGDAEAGVREVEARRRAQAGAVRLREELERDHPDLDALRTRIRRAEDEGEAWTVDPEIPATRRARLHELDDRIEERTRRLEALDKDLQFLGRRTRIDELDGEILGLREEADDLRRRRDRLWALSRIVQEAERSIREEHRPGVLREASTILAGLTAGRYDRIVLSGRDGRDFRIRGPATPDALPVASPLSTGTREQVYLALRLAILDQLDRSGERLPLFLDEVLVNWDPERRDAGLRQLAERSRFRQCFFFTCHPDLADRLVALGGTRVRLPGPAT